jgi:hypothetical protein
MPEQHPDSGQPAVRSVPPMSQLSQLSRLPLWRTTLLWLVGRVSNP